MKVIIGLGNPGINYTYTRHNVGFRTVDRIAEKCGSKRERNTLSSILIDTEYKGERFILAKPQTYMNVSGRAVREIMHWYKLEPQDILIISDDIDLPLGKIRLRPHGGAGTHNGLRSIIAETYTDKFPRIRIGIGSPPENMELASFVLSKFTDEDMDIINSAIDKAANAALEFILYDIERAMNIYNTNK